MEKLAVTIAEACQVLSLGRSKLLELAYAGEIKSYTVGVRRYFRVADLQEYLEGRRQAEEEGQGRGDGA